MRAIPIFFAKLLLAWVLMVHVSTGQEAKLQEIQKGEEESSIIDKSQSEFSQGRPSEAWDLYDKEDQIQIRMARAEVYYDIENYGLAREEIDWVLAQEPKRPDALILRGKVLLKMRFDHSIGDDFINADVIHELKIGDPIRVNLRDASVDFDGDIEYVITSGLGDRETLILKQVEGDQTQFRAQQPTKAGTPQAGDKVLQTQVGDEITIELSPASRAKMKIMNASAVKCRVVTGD